MANGMNRGDRLRLALHLEKQGARIKKTKAGFVAYVPTGTVGWHLSPSGPRNDWNLRKDIERLGLSWPF